jgi:hypothetical protein
MLNTKVKYSELIETYKDGLINDEKYKIALLKYGKCVIDVPIKPIPLLFVTECLNPYYLF